MEHARTLDESVAADESPLAHARLKRQLTIDEAAKRAGVAPEELHWLEEGRLYRFPTPDRALLVTLLCATALGVDHREALELAGPARRRRSARTRCAGSARSPRSRALVVAATLAVVLAQGGSTAEAVRRRLRRRDAARAVGDQRRRAERQRRLRVDAPGREPDPGALVQDRQGRGRRRASTIRRPRCTTRRAPRRSRSRLAKQLGVPVQPLPGGLDAAAARRDRRARAKLSELGDD